MIRTLPPALLGLVLTLTASLGADSSRAEWADFAADAVIGQSSFDSNTGLALSAATFATPKGVAIDRSTSPNRAYVADSDYHRVLGWSDVDAMTNGAPADIVIGQADFVSTGCNRQSWSGGFTGTPSLSTLCSPANLAVSPAGRLYVADSDNCRVLAFDDPFGTDQVADQVIGQPNGTTSTCNGTMPSASNLFLPRGVATDGAGNVYVADFGHCRVLEYDDPSASDTTADRVFGQSTFTGRNCATISSPSSVAVDPAGTLWAATGGFVYGFVDPLTGNNAVDRTLGSQQCNESGENASSTCGPIAVATDAAGRLFVADAGNSRVLEFDSPTSISQAARVFGQSGFGGSADLFHDACNLGGPSASTLCLRQVVLLTLGGTYYEAAALDTDSAGRLYVADGLNHRVLRYDAPTSSDTVADLVLGHSTMTDVRKPVLPTVDPVVAAGYGSEVVVLDRAASRLLIYASHGSYPDQPQAIIGQPDIATTGCNSGGISASTLCQPSAATVDQAGNLWVADTGNNRVLMYAAPWFTYDYLAHRYEARASATAVHGQPNFTSNACGAGTTGLCGPQGIAVDPQSQIYISDSGNHRVVQNQNPLADSTFERVFGQASMAGTSCNSGGTSASSLCDPRGIAVAGDDVLLVADRGNHRVLAYLDAAFGNTTADRVFGQGGSFASAAAGAGANGLSSPTGLALDPGGNLFVADAGNHRVLEFDVPLAGDTTADRVLGQPNFSSSSCNAGGVSASSLCTPTSIAIESSYSTDRIYVGDTGNQRVLRIDAPFCRADFTVTPANRSDHTQRSKPTNTTLKLKRGPGAADDVLTIRGGLVLLERDGGVSAGDEPLLTLSNAGGIVYQERTPSLSNIRTKPEGGVWGTQYLKGERDTGIDDFVVDESFVIPTGFSDKPQYDRVKYRGRSVGLSLPGLVDGPATWRYQYGSYCFTTEMSCSTNASGARCRPAR